jgi:hypothetical protein
MGGWVEVGGVPLGRHPTALTCAPQTDLLIDAKCPFEDALLLVAHCSV